jgi:HSP20 family protein
MARRDPEEWFWQVGSELQRLSHGMIQTRQTIVRRSFWEPRVDVLEDDTQFILKAEIAGVRGEEIQLLWDENNHAIVIRGNRRDEEHSDIGEAGCYQLEIYYGDFEREVSLPDVPVNVHGMKAHYRNGILTVRIPKRGDEPSGDL